MTKQIPDAYRDLIDNPNIAILATITEDNKPNASPVWVMYDGTHIIINSARGRKKDRNIVQNPYVAITITDPDNMYRYLEVRGVVEETYEENAVADIDALAKKYKGVEKYFGNFAPAEQADKQTRVTYKIKPVNIITQG